MMRASLCRWCLQPVRMVEGGWGSIGSPLLHPVLFCAAAPHQRHSVCPPAQALAEILNVYRSL